VLVLAGATVKALEEYNGRTARFVQVQCSELQTMVAMLTETMTTVAVGTEGSAVRLQDIARQLHSASLLEDFQAAKVRLSECLGTLNSEIARQREDSARQVSTLKGAIEKSQERRAAVARTDPSLDPVTGMADRTEAEAALAQTVTNNEQAFAAAFVIERLDLVNIRFGRQVGDQLLRCYAQHLAQSFGDSACIFRWSGPALLALLVRDASIAVVREEITKVNSVRLTKSVTLGPRSVLLPIAAHWAVFPTREVRPVPVLAYHIDAFINSAAKTASGPENKATS
jgi:GGDEF domain-containing protein